MATTIEKLKEDQDLRPYFFDFVCKGFILGLSDTFKVSEIERVRFQRDYYDALHDLTEKIEKRVTADEVLPTIQQVSVYYLSHIGRIGFESYEPLNK